ncbi:MAG: hypothetical protein ACKOYC_09155, partial [Bacteroidota bacterium]
MSNHTIIMKPTKNKTGSLTLTILAFLVFGVANAQSISPQSINSSGITFSQTGGSLSFTVGELVVLNQSDSSGNSLGGGFTNGATLTTEVVNAPDEALLDVSV